VGYRKPPRHSQFKKGTSGNPKGRRKGSINFATHIENALNEKVIVNENGRRKKISKKEAAAKQFANKAASGDPKSIGLLLGQATGEAVAAAGESENAGPLPEIDRLVAQRLFGRIRSSDPFELGSQPLSEGSSPAAESERTDKDAGHDNDDAG
jgi:hypothetical protein